MQAEFKLPAKKHITFVENYYLQYKLCAVTVQLIARKSSLDLCRSTPSELLTLHIFLNGGGGVGGKSCFNSSVLICCNSKIYL